MPGIRTTDGADLQLRLEMNVKTGEITVPMALLRTDTWPFWLAEAVSAAVAAAEIDPITQESLADNDEVTRLLVAELRASMRTFTSCAFAIDAFYASVKARSPAHPQQAVWHKKGTARHKQVAETLRHHLQVRSNEASKLLSNRIQEIFRFRDWAVHPGSQFKQAIHRPDVDAAVDWHFIAFSTSNALAGVANTIQLFDHMVNALSRGSDELAKRQPAAREAMDHVLDAYESSDKLLKIGRAEPPGGD